jgi:hypothetical protein
MKRFLASTGLTLAAVVPVSSNALLPPPTVECCNRKDYTSEQCARFKLDEAMCVKAVANFNETFQRLQAINNPKPAPVDADAPQVKTYRGKFFEIQYPASFAAQPIDAAREVESDAATFSAPDQSATFYVFSPQWAGEAPRIALDASKEIEVERRTGKGKSSGVDGSFTWITIAAKDKSYTRSYQRFEAGDNSIVWVIGLKYSSADALMRHQAAYARFKASLKQLAD